MNLEQNNMEAHQNNKPQQNNRRLGQIGETAAAELLREKGYKIMCMNYRCRHGEIDIIATKGIMLSFIEVKMRTKRDYGRPCEAVDSTKQQRIRMAAYHYLKELGRKGYVPIKVTFDVIEIVAEHIEGAF